MDVFERGITIECFQAVGKIPFVRHELRINNNGSRQLRVERSNMHPEKYKARRKFYSFKYIVEINHVNWREIKLV